MCSRGLKFRVALGASVHAPRPLLFPQAWRTSCGRGAHYATRVRSEASAERLLRASRQASRPEAVSTGRGSTDQRCCIFRDIMAICASARCS